MSGAKDDPRLAIDGSRIVKPYPIELSDLQPGTRIQISRDPYEEPMPKTGVVKRIVIEKRVGTVLTIIEYHEDQTGHTREVFWPDDPKDACLDIIEARSDQSDSTDANRPTLDISPTPSPDREKNYRSPQELLAAYPIVLMFRLGLKDRERFKRRFLNNPDYETFFEALVPHHRDNLRWLHSTLSELESDNLVRGGDYAIGRFAVFPVRGNTGDDLGENFLILQQEGGPLVWLGKLGLEVGKEALKLIIQAMRKAWDDARDFEIDHVEVRARGLPGTVKIPMRGIDIYKADRPGGSLIGFLGCLQHNFPKLTTLNPPPPRCVKKLGSIPCSFEG